MNGFIELYILRFEENEKEPKNHEKLLRIIRAQVESLTYCDFQKFEN